MHQIHPIRKLTRAIHQPLIRNQITFTRNETAPPPYSIRLPNGQNEIAANLKHCKPYGIPTTLIHHNTPDRTHAIPLMKPPNRNQQILPNNLIFNTLVTGSAFCYPFFCLIPIGSVACLCINKAIFFVFIQHHFIEHPVAKVLPVCCSFFLTGSFQFFHLVAFVLRLLLYV